MLSSSQRIQVHKRFFSAAQAGWIEEVRSFLNPPFSYPVDLQNEVGRTALMYACFEGHISLVRVLVEEYGADVMKATDMGGSAIQSLIQLKNRKGDPAKAAAAEQLLEYFVKRGVHFSAQALAELGDLNRLKKCSSLDLDSLKDSGGVMNPTTQRSSLADRYGRSSDVGAITASANISKLKLCFSTAKNDS